MFRDRPLTWLFIAATLAVDLVLLPSYEYVQLGLVLGQLSAAAIWLIMNDTFYLAKAGAFLVVTSLILGKYTESTHSGYDENEILTRLVAFTLGIIAATIPVALLRFWAKGGFEKTENSRRWQFSLIEMFGWTIIVAYVSFTSRFINFEILCELKTLWLILPVVPIPWMYAMMLEDTAKIESKNVFWFKVIVFLLAVLIWYICIEIIFMVSNSSNLASARSDSPSWLVLTCYLVSWAFVRRLDNSNTKLRLQYCK